MGHQSAEEQALELVRKEGILRARDLVKYGIDDKTLTRLVRRGKIRRIGRGLYLSADVIPSSEFALAAASRRVRHGIICLLSALSYHGLTTQVPREVWMAVEWTPVIGEEEWPPFRFFRFSGRAFMEGVETHEIEGIEGIEIKVYSPAKTVADCFKYRNKIGLDVALEALRDCLARNKCGMDEIWRYAKLCNVANIIRPYLEATT